MNKLEAYRQVCIIAGGIVIETAREGKSRAYVDRSLLHRLEDALIKAGFDIPKARAGFDSNKKALNKTEKAARDAEIVAKFPNGTRVRVGLYGPAPKGIPRLEYGTVRGPSKRDMVFVGWDSSPAGWVSAYYLELATDGNVPKL